MKSSFLPKYERKIVRISALYLHHCTVLHFASFLSGGFTTMAVINPPERNLAKRTSVHCKAEILTIFRSYFGRIHDTIDCFRDLLTFITVLWTYEVRFASFLSGGFITAIVVNPPKSTGKTHLCAVQMTGVDRMLKYYLGTFIAFNKMSSTHALICK